MDQKLTREQLDKIHAIRKDFYRYCKNNLKIKDKHSRIIPFEPNIPQRILIDYVLLCIKEQRPVKAIILKARQMGLSTAVEAIIYWWTSTNKNINSVIIGHEESSSKNLYMMFRRYYDNTHPLFKPNVRYNTRTDLSFERFDETGKQVGLGSSIKTATAGNKAAGRSDTINLLHASELGEWENGEDLVASLLETVPDEPIMEKPSMMFLESTAKGRGNYFHTEFKNAMKRKNNFEPFFFPWWILDSYERDADLPLGELSEYEVFLIDLMKKGHTVAGQHIEIDPAHIPAKVHFYRRKKKNFESTPEKLTQEYPSTWQEAFISSGKNVFDSLALQELENNAIAPEAIEYYKITPGELHEQHILLPVPFDPREDPDDFTYKAPLKIFKHPEPGHEYAIGGDVAEGLVNGDFSVAEVVDQTTMETVARWRGHIDPDKFGEILGALGVYYNYALIGVEVNNHGLTTIQKLRDTYYTNLFKREKGYDEDFEEPTSNLGWKTDVRTKRLAVDSLITLIREGINKDPDLTFIDEAFAYIRDERGRTNAEEGEHDDTVMAKAIAFQIFDWGDNDIRTLRVHKPKDAVRNKQKHNTGR
jgi:hypothetical protein